jgi:hypothetical protein
VEVVDAGGYEVSATLLGRPTNQGTVERPVHTRMVQVSRTRSGLTGTSTSQMTLRITPADVTAI